MLLGPPRRRPQINGREMTRKELAYAGAAGALAAVLTTAGSQLAVAQEGAHAVNPAPMAPPAGVAPGSFADIIQRVAPAVVAIEVEQKAPLQSAMIQGEDPLGELRRMFPGLPDVPEMPRPGPIHGAGSGFFVSPDGYIVTNNHVVDGAQKITVRTADNRTLPARVIGRDPATDLAVVKVEGRGFPYVNFEDRARPRVGDWVVAVGNPFGLSGTATAGIVSSLKRPNISGSSYVDYLQIDAPINRGNSGGPTFDVYGRVVGVNSAIFTPSGGSVGIGFDIPADVADRVVKQLISEGRVVRGFIGATVQDVTPEIAQSLGVRAHDGALVAEVTPGGPSDRAGLKMGDLIERVDGRPIESAAGLTRSVAVIHPGQVLRLQVRRDGHPVALAVTAGVRPAETELANAAAPDGAAHAAPGTLGLMIAPNPGGGARIEQVDPASDAARKGLRPGDVIQSINGRRIASSGDVAAAMQAVRAEHRGEVLLLVERDGRHIYVPVKPIGAG